MAQEEDMTGFEIATFGSKTITECKAAAGRKPAMARRRGALLATTLLSGLLLLGACSAGNGAFSGRQQYPGQLRTGQVQTLQVQRAGSAVGNRHRDTSPVGAYQLAQDPGPQDWPALDRPTQNQAAPRGPSDDLAAEPVSAGLQLAQDLTDAAQPAQTPSLISADNIVHDEALGTVTASGNVEITHEGRTLRADTVSYNVNSDIVSASGNVSVTDRSGDVVFADFVELTGDLREGFIRDIRVLMVDRSRLAAASARRSTDGITLLRRGVFSPCALCREDPTRAPLWQLKAVEVEMDETEEVIRYRDAWMEFYGVPVFYTPYFEHPSPAVERKSGFLAPTFGNTTQLGIVYQQPYYWTLAPNRDLTIAPMITTKQGPVLTGEFRELLPEARVELDGSLTVAERESANGEVENGKVRGHIDSKINLDLNDRLRGGLHINRATDDTYLRLYNFSNAQTLTSRAFLEGFEGRNYAAANAYVFQGLRQEDESELLPIVAPLLELSYLSDPLFGDARARFDGNFLALHRTEGSDTRRLAGIAGLEVPFDGPIGDRFLLTGELTAGGYWSNDLDGAADPTGSQFASRLFPMAALDWRYPWARLGETATQVIEPRIQLVAAPNGGNPTDIPNEDSLDFDLNDTNLFRLNRFTGLDRVSSGSRIDYGISYSLYDTRGNSGTAFLGQSYLFEDKSPYKPGTGHEEQLSDIVGRLSFESEYDVDLYYRFRLDKDNGRFRRNEIALSAGPAALNLQLTYAKVRGVETEDEILEDREELNWRLASKLTENWRIFGGTRQDLISNDTLEGHLGIGYEDECFQIQLTGRRSFFTDREIKAEDSIFLKVVFKHLGGVSLRP